jgi:phosphatidylserine decarboxylase
MTFGQRLFIGLQHCLPKRWIGRLVYHAVRWRWRPLKNLMISRFIHYFQIDMEEAEQSDPTRYPHFNAFFTRALQPDARPVNDENHSLVSPADGTLTQWGPIEAGRILQAKGLDYSVDDLLGSERPVTAALTQPSFATIYLAPYNYHRVHMPIAGRLAGMHYIPGETYSVNGTTARGIPNLFARNERVVCWFAGSGGYFALVLVGAFNVATISTVWTGEIAAQRHAQFWPYNDPQLTFAKGAEIGHFNLGSTVVMVFGQPVQWLPTLQPTMTTRMGEKLGRCLDG